MRCQKLFGVCKKVILWTCLVISLFDFFLDYQRSIAKMFNVGKMSRCLTLPGTFRNINSCYLRSVKYFEKSESIQKALFFYGKIVVTVGLFSLVKRRSKVEFAFEQSKMTLLMPLIFQISRFQDAQFSPVPML